MLRCLLGIPLSTPAAGTCGAACGTASSVLPGRGWCWDPRALPWCAPLVLGAKKLGVESCSVLAGTLLPTLTCTLSCNRNLQVCDVKPLGLGRKHFWMLYLKQLNLESSHLVLILCNIIIIAPLCHTWAPSKWYRLPTLQPACLLSTGISLP